MPHAQKVGPYAMSDVLGEGTFAVVRLAVNTQTGERVAVKCVPKRKIAKMHMGHQMRNEISIMKMIRHPNVVRLREVLMSSTTVYLVMELVRGGELYDLISKGRMSHDTSRKYFRELMLGVAYCHALNACHRDLKPENLLIDEHGTLKIADFGFSALVEFEPNATPASPVRVPKDDAAVVFDDFILDPETRVAHLESGIARRMSTVCGTCAYIAPEVLTREGYDGRQADVWSCGVIGFVLCAGFLPFDDHDKATLFRKIESERITYPPWFTPEQVDVLSHLLERDPNVRYTAEQVLRHPWVRVNEDAKDAKESVETARVQDATVLLTWTARGVTHAKLLEDVKDALNKIGWDARVFSNATTTHFVRATRLSSSGTLGISVDASAESPDTLHVVVHRRIGDFGNHGALCAQLVETLSNLGGPGGPGGPH